MIRLFVGIALPDDIRVRLAPLAGGIPGAHWVPEENLHITLRFLGDIDETRAESVHEELETIRASGFDLELMGVGTFGRGRAPHTLWVGVSPSPPLIHLREKIDSAVRRAGEPPEERKFAPHISIAKLRDPHAERLHEFIAAHNLIKLSFAVERFVLFSSQLGNSDPVYTEETDYPLLPQ